MAGGDGSYVLLGAGRSAVEVYGSVGVPGYALHFCAKMDNSSVKCWGGNFYGQLGIGTSGPDTDRGAGAASMQDLPVLNFGSNVEPLKVVLGDWHGCAVLDTGKLKCWGNNAYGMLARPDTTEILPDEPNGLLPPVDFGSEAEVADAAAGAYTSCAIFKNTTLTCWGFTGQQGGMLGRGFSGQGTRTDPQLVDLGANNHAVQVAIGRDHICALLNTSKVKCWGSSQYGQLGNGNTDTIGDGANEMGDALATVPNIANVTSITAGTYHTCVIFKNHSVSCWGANGNGQSSPGISGSIGDADSEVGTRLIPLSDGSGNVNATELACGNAFSCARLSNKSVYCWGAGAAFDQYRALN